MQEKKDGASYAPKGKARPTCAPGEFPVAAIGLDHGHIYGMCNGLSEAGADIAYVYDRDPEKVKAFRQKFPHAKLAGSIEEALCAPVRMIATAAVPADRAGIAIAAMKHGKDAFSDKPGLTTPLQAAALRAVQKETGKRYFIYFSERLHVEASVRAGEMIREGEIGKVVQVMGWGPHRLSETTRPGWFFDPERYGGILTDIGCHQIEQILYFAGAEEAVIEKSRIGNYAHSRYPGFQDYGDCLLRCENGVAGYFRVDWFTPDGLAAWGDGRTLIVGTEGTLEIRKYIDLGRSAEGDHIYLADEKGERHIEVAGTCGFPFFGQMIRDCLDGTETAMRQEYVFRVMELAICAQREAEWIIGANE